MKYIHPEKFMFAAHQSGEQLYIVHSGFPMAIIAVVQTIPAKLFIVETELYDDNAIDDPENQLGTEDQELLAKLLLDAAEWYRQNVIPKSS